MHDYVCFIAPIDLETFYENCSHFILKWFQPNSFGELCFVEMGYGNMQKIPIFENFESALYSTSASMPLMGDFNINLLNHDTYSPTADFIDVLNSFSLYPSITKPTRITSKTATLIDNIFTNSYSKQTARLILTDISDHLPFFFISTNLTVYRKDDKRTKVKAGDVSDENIRNFNNKLCQVD